MGVIAKIKSTTRAQRYAAACIASVAVIAVLLAATVLTLSSNDGSPSSDASNEVDMSQVSGLDNLDFLDDSGKAALGAALKDYLTASGYSWPTPVEFMSKVVQDGTERWCFCKTKDGTFHVCDYDPEATRSSAFAFSELTYTVAGVNDTLSVVDRVEVPSSSSSSSQEDEASSSPSGTAGSSADAQQGATAAAPSASDGSATQTVPSGPTFKASNVTKLAGYIGKDPASLFPSLLEQYYAGRGISGTAATTSVYESTCSPDGFIISVGGTVIEVDYVGNNTFCFHIQGT